MTHIEAKSVVIWPNYPLYLVKVKNETTQIWAVLNFFLHLVGKYKKKKKKKICLNYSIREITLCKVAMHKYEGVKISTFGML